MHTQKNLFVVVEGIDRSGKTTICHTLSQRIPNTTRLSFPDRSLLTGELLNKYLRNEVTLNPQTTHLLFSANRWELQDEMKKMNGIVVCDRYYFSGIAYTAAKGVDIEWCRGVDRGLIEPDLLVYIDMPVVEAIKRNGFGEEKYERVEFQTKVYCAYRKLIGEYGGKKIIIDGMDTVENNADKVIDAIEKLL